MKRIAGLLIKIICSLLLISTISPLYARRKSRHKKAVLLAQNDAPEELEINTNELKEAEEVIEQEESADDEIELEGEPEDDDQENLEEDDEEITDDEEELSISDDEEEELEELDEEQDESEEVPDEAEQEVADIYLNFENSDLLSFVNYIAEIKQLNIIPDKAIAGNKISLTIRKPLTITGAYNVFLTIIEMAGFSIVKVGDVHKIIPKAQKAQQPLPAYINVPYKDLPDTDENIRFVTFLENINVNSVKDLVIGMLGVPNSVIEQPNVNGLIITAKSFDIKAAMNVVAQLDQTGLQESVVVMRLKQANARDVKELFESLMRQPKGHPLARLLGKKTESSAQYFSPTTKIIAEERTNSLILLGNAKSIKKIEEFITNHLDTELKEVQSPLHIYELQYADAEQVAEILQHVTSSGELETEAGQQAAKYGAVRGGVKYFKSMKFKVDKPGNRLIVSSTDKQDWALLEKTIQDLDKAQPQVAIETLIVTVNVDDKKQIGSQLRNRRHGRLGKHLDIQTANLGAPIKSDTDPTSLLGNLISSFTSELGSTILTFGRSATNGVWGALKMLKQITNTSVISQPFITVANKATANISVGETRRIRVQQAVSESGDDGSAVGFESKEVATTINVTPQINIDGVIKFDIKVNISEFVGDIGDTQEKNLKTGAMVADGQVLVLGGFVKTKVTESANKTPVLNKIPLLGWLFKNKRRTITKDYIFIFMCPTILKPRRTPGLGLYTKMKLHDATDHIEDAVETKRVTDPIHNWFFNPDGEDYSHKVVDFANARYQPTIVDVANDPYYRTKTKQEMLNEMAQQETPISSAVEQVEQIAQMQPEEVELDEQAEEPEVEEQEEVIEGEPEAEEMVEEQTAQPAESPAPAPKSLDVRLEQQRQKLKALLQANPVVPAQKAHAAKPANPLKTFIASQPSGGEV